MIKSFIKRRNWNRIRHKKLQIVITCLLSAGVSLLKKKRNRRWWVKPWLTQEGNKNISEHLCKSEDITSVRNFLRMNENTFEKLLEMVEEKISKRDTHLRSCIPAKLKLIITLRYLATGESFTSLMYNFRISLSSISLFIPDVCKCIYETLKNEYLPVWLFISSLFQKITNNVLGT